MNTPAERDATENATRGNLIESRTKPRCESNTYTLKRHYDQSRYNEIYAAGTQFINTPETGPVTGQGIGINPLNEGQTGVNNWFLISIPCWETGNICGGGTTASIKSKDYPKLFYTMESSSLNEKHYVYFNLYERDWYASKKNLGKVQYANGQHNFFQGRRKYYDEWLGYDPGPNLGEALGSLSHLRNTRFPVQIMQTSGQIQFTGDQDKCRILFKRVN